MRNAISSNTTLRTILGTLLVCGGGLALVAASEYILWLKVQHPATGEMAKELGKVLFVTGGIALLWELWSKRSFAMEVLVVAHLSEQIKNAGLVDLPVNYNRVDWGGLFATAKEIDVFFAYGSTWVKTNIDNLRTFAATAGNVIRVVVPDINNQVLLEQLAARFATDTSTIKSRINETLGELRTIFRNGTKAKLQLLAHNVSPVFTLYRFDQTMVLTLYTHRKIRLTVPVFVIKHGTLYDFAHQEFEAIISEQNGLARLLQSEDAS